MDCVGQTWVWYNLQVDRQSRFLMVDQADINSLRSSTKDYN